jgi:serine/threonine-protein kinase
MSLQGKRIANYTLLRLIGDGAMGEVYECIGKDGRPAAIKVMNSEFADDPVFQGRFVREARMMASLNHPNIVPVLDHGVSDGHLYLVMKLINGPTLSKVMKQRKFSPLAAWNIIKPLTAALDFGHQQGIIHRDVKPSNVLLEQTQGGTQLYLMDFGLAKVPGVGMTLTETGSLLAHRSICRQKRRWAKTLIPAPIFTASPS